MSENENTTFAILAFGVGAACVGAAGSLMTPLLPFTAASGLTFTVTSFNIVIIGGMGSFLGSLLAAVLVAFVQVFGTYYFPDFALAAMYLLMLLGQ